jgi:hypothetical protein
VRDDDGRGVRESLGGRGGQTWHVKPERWDFGQGFGECLHQSVVLMIDDVWVGHLCGVCVCVWWQLWQAPELVMH